jgi:beta-carotene 3-hydroxylase
MEGATWLIHKYIMHGFLWVLHKDHHDHSNTGNLEKNDYFFFIFALPTIALMYFGSLKGFNFMVLPIFLFTTYLFINDLKYSQIQKVLIF